MQTPPPLRSGHIYMKDAHSAESNEKSYIRFFWFLVFELWLIEFTIYDDTLGVPPTKTKKLSKSGQICRKKWPNLVFEIMVDLDLVVMAIASIFARWHPQYGKSTIYKIYDISKTEKKLMN